MTSLLIPHFFDALSHSLSTYTYNVSKQIKCWSKWLTPGLYIKRWLAVNITGILFTSLGIVIFLKLTPVYRLIILLADMLAAITNILPSYILGIIAIAITA